MRLHYMRRLLGWLLIAALIQTTGAAAAATRRKKVRKPASVSKPATARKSVRHKRVSKKWAKRLPMVDPTAGDNIDGDDLAIRRAAVEALGNYNGSVVVVDPSTGRILTIVNQRLAFTSGFTPCSTIKLVTALAALSEGIVERDTPIRLGRYQNLNLTSALAHSNNPYFAILGRRLGFDRVTRYARMFGLGERAGLDIEGEQPGVVPEEEPVSGGVGMLTSFGEGILMTPLELASLVSAIANGGTLYYLQYPRSHAERESFEPRVKRKLEIYPWLGDVKVGMRAAVDFGTARRAGYDQNEPILGKTGTCTDFRASTHLGWFASFNDVGRNKLVTVVLLTGGRPVNGPVAAGVAGAFYRQLSEQHYFAGLAGSSQVGLFSTQACCAR